MYPVNQFFMNGDNAYPQVNDLDSQMRLLEEYKAKLTQLSQSKQSRCIWDEIDDEVNSLNDIQKQKLFANEEYANNANQLQAIVQNELLKLVKGKISTGSGKTLLEHQLELVKKLKKNIIDDTNREMDMFNKFREYSKTNPNITYDEFIKTTL